jgi:hypothetical protein
MCPDVEEAMKWSFPHFVYKGMLCSMASFKEHAALGFWKGELVLGRGRGAGAMGHFGRLTKLSDLPSKKALAGYVKKAVTLNELGVKAPRQPRKAAPKTLKRRPPLPRLGLPLLPERLLPLLRAALKNAADARRKARRGGSRRRSRGWPKASRGTGSMRVGAS